MVENCLISLKMFGVETLAFKVFFFSLKDRWDVFARVLLMLELLKASRLLASEFEIDLQGIFDFNICGEKLG